VLPSCGFDLGSAMARGAVGSRGALGSLGLGFLSPIFVSLLAVLVAVVASNSCLDLAKLR
jgi:hypothetical protein